MGTPNGKSWARLSFDEALDSLTDLTEGEHFQCIAMPRGSVCHKPIEDIQVKHALETVDMLGDHPAVTGVRDLIHCLVCDDHSQTRTYVVNVENAWKPAFADGFFNGHRSSSPYSRDRKRTTSIMARQTPPRTPTPRSSILHRPSRSSTNSIPRIHLTPDDPNSLRQGRGSSARQPPAQDLRDSPAVDTPMSETDRDFEVDSPTAGRSQQVRRSSGASDSQSPVVETSEAAPSPPSEPPLTSGPAPASSGRRRRRPLGESLHDDGFHLGVAANWAPWTIRSKVIELLQEPVPGPKAKGQLYVVRVTTGSNQRYVKIGYTTRSVDQRLSEIQRQHGITLDMDSAKATVNIPIMQLLRLEALVHADLAFFQRDLAVVQGQRVAYRVEYFEISQAEAWATVQLWLSIMEGTGMAPGRELDADTRDGIQLCSAEFETFMSDEAESEQDQWVRVNSDHEYRKSIWNEKIPKRDLTLSRKTWERSRKVGLFFGQGFLAATLVIWAFDNLDLRYVLAAIVIGTWALVDTCRTEVFEWVQGAIVSLKKYSSQLQHDR